MNGSPHKAVHQAVISLGSNIEPQRNIQAALVELRRRFRIVAQSAPQCTKPVGFTQQADFLNAAVRIETTMERDELEGTLKELEASLGRVRGPNKHGPRTIDLDVVVWDGHVVDEDVRTRDFLRQLVLEVWPELGL